MALTDKILSLTRQLYPTGRAFKMPYDGYLESLHKALAVSEAQAINDAKSILDSVLPDNDNFTEDDASQWELRLGLITNSSVSLADRKLAIKRKMNHPGTIKARQHYLYLEGQLQADGFDVYVWENTDNLPPYDIIDIVGSGQFGDFQMGDIQFGDDVSFYPELFDHVQFGNYQMNDVQMGNAQEYNHKVANSLIRSDDANFNVGLNFRNTFFIGGTPKGTFATVDADREKEFRQLILKIKPTQTVAYLLINYL